MRREIRTIGAALAALALTAGCSFSMYEKGNVRRVEVQKKSGEPTLAADAYWSDDAKSAGAGGRAVHVRIARGSDVQLARTVHYNSIVWTSTRSAAWPLWEVLELATSPLYLPIYLIFVPVGLMPPEAPYIYTPASTKLMLATAPINPFVTTFSSNIERSEIADAEHFADKPVELKYRVRLPARALHATWRALGDGGAELGKGEGTTDLFGELVLADAPAATKQVEVSAPGLAPVTLPVR